MPTLGDVVAALERRYPTSWAASWDAVGLVCGAPEDNVRRVLFAVDPVAATVQEAIDTGAQLLVTHHPLFLSGVHGVPATSYKGRLVHDLIRHGIGLYAAHTNADSADPGVSDALAAALGLTDLRPLRPDPADPLDVLVTYVPESDTERLVDALGAAGAGAVGDYSRCAWLGEGTGTFLPGAQANPTIGTVGSIARVAETRVEMVLSRPLRARV
ncbi:MAG: Nif3-like dinuclear metal center hexameric protein, partial [Actinomycetota bacterium]|nr:Nif3-like dinuclear metal center hexameric protein [Actinomycetota bacterium]